MRARTPAVAELVRLIEQHHWHDLFVQAVDQVVEQEISDLSGIRTLDD